MFKVIGGGAGVFKVMRGGSGRQPCSSRWEGVRGVSYVQGGSRGRGASAMFFKKVM